MDNSITVKEIHLKYWRPFTIILGMATVVLFVIFWNLNDPLWESIFRIGAFLCFAGTVFGALKLIEGSLILKLRIEDQKLNVRYFKEGKIVREEDFDLSEINGIFPSVPNKNWSLPFIKSRFEGFIINFNDSEHVLFLFEFGGRPLVFPSEKVEQITSFLSQYQLIRNPKSLK